MAAAPSQAQPAKDISVELEAYAQDSTIVLTWSLEDQPDQHVLFRSSGGSNFQQLAQLTGADTTYKDDNVMAGRPYEYYLLRVKGQRGTATGYVATGLDLMPVEQLGGMILAIDSTSFAVLTDRIERTRQLLWADGWQVRLLLVGRNETPEAIRGRIRSIYEEDNFDAQALWLMGQVPVPYAGGYQVAPDGHSDHNGAWPADVYYGALDINWTDASVNNDSTRTANRNVPNDGRFDQTQLTQTPQLMVGRTSFHEMPAFNDSSELLLARYLDRDHTFRRGIWKPRALGIVEDNFANMPEGFSQMAWRGFTALLGKERVREADYFAFLRDSGALFSYGCGAGSFTRASGIANSSDFADTTVNGAFTFLFGSYFGDWNTRNNFLRAPLASEAPVLTNAWSGRPNWYIHPMATGQPIGRCLQISQSNGLNQNTARYQPAGSFPAGVHVALMGDPGLRMHYYQAPRNLDLTFVRFPGEPERDSNLIRLSWNRSPDTMVQAYVVYRQDTAEGVFERLHEGFRNDSFFVDSNPWTDRANVYMVRPMALQPTGSGLIPFVSTGVLDTIGAATTQPVAVAEAGGQRVQQVKVYPNPVVNDLQLRVSSPIRAICILDAGGREVYRNLHPPQRTSWRMKRPDVPPGVYHIVVHTEGFMHVRQLLFR